MIKSIHLKQFQNHRDTKLEFSPGVNIITGPSRQGKTAIIRALRWVAENRPAGDEFRRHGAGKAETSVDVQVDDYSISRHKGTANYYALNGEQFNGFGQDVPKPVSDALNLGEINIQHQFDTPYLLFDSPGQVARTLNRIVHLDTIDTALSNVAALKRQNDQDSKVQQARLDELEEQMAGFPDLEAAEEFIVELEAMSREVEAKRLTMQVLEGLQASLASLRIELAQTAVPDGMEERVAELLRIQNEAEQKRYTINLLKTRQESLSTLRVRLAGLEPLLAAEDRVTALARTANGLAAKRKLLARTRSLNEQIDSQRLLHEQKTTIIRQEEAEYKRLWPGRCPLCGK